VACEPSNDRILAPMQSGRWFQSLPDALRQQLQQQGSVRRLAAGQPLFARGDVSDGLYCVLDGSVRISGVSVTGKEALLAIIEPPHWFGEIALFDGQSRTHDARAEGPATLFHVQQAALIRLLDTQPAYWHDFGLLLAHKLRTTFLVLEDAALLPAADRLVRRLVVMAEGYGEWTTRSRRELLVPQEQLARMMSLSRQTVNQILKQLEAQNLIRLARGGIEILDINALRTMARR
jgi:CRP/FNR family transcriptional regulator, cyclic AMP receptor protein